MNPRMIALWSNQPIPDLAQVKFASLVMRRTTMATWVILISIKGTKDWLENVIKNRFPLALPSQEQTHSIKEQSSTYIMARRQENEKLPANRPVKMSTSDLLNSKNELYTFLSKNQSKIKCQINFPVQNVSFLATTSIKLVRLFRDNQVPTFIFSKITSIQGFTFQRFPEIRFVMNGNIVCTW